jgi:peptidoglycan/LPS O-acetylase OafA/YrhL
MSATGESRGLPAHVQLGRRDNALNGIRLVLAGFVVVDHSFRAATGRPGPWPSIGGFGVDGFFAISGYLIAGSRSRMGMRPFLWRRALRLMPAYWVVLVVTALLIAPLSAVLSDRGYSWSSAVSYVVRDSMLFMLQMGIDGTPAGVPYEGLWNTSTWTLPIEAAAYIFFGLVVAMPGFGRRAAAATCLALSSASLVLVLAGAGLTPIADLTRLWSFFAAGVLLWRLRQSLPGSRWSVAGAATVVMVSLVADNRLYLAVAPVPLAFVLLWLGSRLPVRVGSRNDISYGLYLFAYPLQQLMIVGGIAAAVGPYWFVVVSIAMTVPVAWASWLFVEQPSLRLRRLVPAAPRPDPHAPGNAEAQIEAV